MGLELKSNVVALEALSLAFGGMLKSGNMRIRRYHAPAITSEQPKYSCFMMFWEPNAFDRKDVDYVNAPGMTKLDAIS